MDNGWAAMALSPITGPTHGPGQHLGRVAGYAEAITSPTNAIKMIAEKIAGAALCKTKYYIMCKKSDRTKYLMKGSKDHTLLDVFVGDTSFDRICRSLCHALNRDYTTGRIR